MNSYFVFTDEAGAYQKNPNEKHIRSHPFYIRSNVLMSIEEYRQYQIDMQRVCGEYEIPYDEEVKWSDLWRKSKGNPRTALINQLSEKRLKGYYRKVFETALNKESTRFMFTITDIVGRTCNLKEENVFKFHLQDAFQRVQMDMEADKGFALFVMDELNVTMLKQIKAVCHAFTLQGDFVQYKNLYQGVLTENSLYSPGIQLADYAAGVMNGYLRGEIVTPGKYQFATDLFDEFVKPRLRKHPIGMTVGFGIIEVPKHPHFREQLISVFHRKS